MGRLTDADASARLADFDAWRAAMSLPRRHRSVRCSAGRRVMSGALICGCERRTRCISRLPGASMRRFLTLDRRLASGRARNGHGRRSANSKRRARRRGEASDKYPQPGRRPLREPRSRRRHPSRRCKGSGKDIDQGGGATGPPRRDPVVRWRGKTASSSVFMATRSGRCGKSFCSTSASATSPSIWRG